MSQIDPIPARPVAAVLAVVLHQGEVLLVRRANPPDAGLWGFPGGKIDAGETLAEAAIRELAEETAVQARALRVLTALDVFDRGADGRLRQHYILIAMLCRWTGGSPIAGDDALEARWVPVAGLDAAGLTLSKDVAELARHAAAIADR